VSWKLSLLDRMSQLWASVPPGFRMRATHAAMPRFLVGVVGLVVDDQRRVLLLEHRFRAPHKWGLPGGYIEHGESLVEALRRELLEELGQRLEVRPEILDVEHNQRGRYLSMTLGAQAPDPAAFRLSGEILKASWFAPEDLPEGTYPYHAQVIRRLIAESDSAE
jgi:8-oxo-dGTP pyrophosphatase MutT (NUDIX family)